jgi:hypothetical protein
VTDHPPALERTPILFVVFAVFGVMLLAFTYATVHRRTNQELASSSPAARAHLRIAYWLEHGYFSTCGLMMTHPPGGKPDIYRSSTGAVLVSSFVLEKIVSSVSGHPSWRLLALHNEVVVLLASVLFALLAFRFARRMGVAPLHALFLAVSLEAVYFTFPDNLAAYWEITGRIWWMAVACIFLLIEERRGDTASRRPAVALAVCAFFMTFAEYVAGLAFLLSFVLLSIIFGDERWTPRRLLVICLLPAVLAIGIHRGQIAVAERLHPDATVSGSGFLFRSGLDGSTMYYRDHLDIAYGRAVARGNFLPESSRPLLFSWPWLFFGAAAAMLFVLIVAARRGVPLPALVSLLALLGAYLLYAAMFSQVVVIHPYYYDVMIFGPLALALFVLAPSIVEVRMYTRGLAVAAIVFLAAWVSLFQLRRYAVMVPLQPQMAGANGVVRALTGGSRPPSVIPPAAPTRSIAVAATGNGGTASPNAHTKLELFDSTQGKPRVSLTGQEFYQPNHTSKDGVALLLGVNRTSNRQLWIGDTAALTQNSTNQVIQLFPAAGAISATATDGVTPKTMLLNVNGGNVGINCNAPGAQLVIASAAGCSAPSSSINAGATQFTAASSRTFKENIVPVNAPNILEKIRAVPVVTYDFKNGGPKDRIGLIAEDFHTVLDRGDEKYIDGQDVQMALWLAVQKLTAQNKELSDRLATLEKETARKKNGARRKTAPR